jgi:hypothetical protein
MIEPFQLRVISVNMSHERALVLEHLVALADGALKAQAAVRVLFLQVPLNTPPRAHKLLAN